jgi:hypothetical protein
MGRASFIFLPGNPFPMQTAIKIQIVAAIALLAGGSVDNALLRPVGAVLGLAGLVTLGIRRRSKSAGAVT